MSHYNRNEIGLEASRGRYRLERDQVEGVALHWPGMKTPLRTVAAVKAALRAWQRDHMHNPDKRWSDIAYQLAVDQAGNTYGLRGMRYRSAANGDQDVNETFGAFLLVLAVDEKPSDKLIRAVRRQIETHQVIFPRSDQVVGHQDVRPEPTACPGPIIEKLIKEGVFTHE